MITMPKTISVDPALESIARAHLDSEKVEITAEQTKAMREYIDRSEGADFRRLDMNSQVAADRRRIERGTTIKNDGDNPTYIACVYLDAVNREKEWRKLIAPVMYMNSPAHLAEQRKETTVADEVAARRAFLNRKGY